MAVDTQITDSLLKIYKANTLEDSWQSLVDGATLLELNIGAYGFAACRVDPDPSYEAELELTSTEWVFVHNYSDEYSRIYEDEGFANYDTTVFWTAANTQPTLWSLIDRPIANGEIGGKFADLYHVTRDFGMENGAVIPLRTRSSVGFGGLTIFTDNELGERQSDMLLRERMGNMQLLAEAFHVSRSFSHVAQRHCRISKREQECLQYLCMGFGHKEIAHLLGTYRGVVEKQIASAKRKLNAKTSIQAVVKALALGLIEPPY